MKSENINELAIALAKAQAQMRPVGKDGKNPHLKNRYATLDSIIEASRKPLSDNGLSFAQLLQQDEAGMILQTLLMHSSGQWLESNVGVMVLVNKGINDLQALGSGLTYMKRYALAAIIGVSLGDDDDGNASGHSEADKPVVLSKVQFFEKVKNEFGIQPEQAAEILKAAGFTNGYDPAKASQYMDAIVAAT